MVTRFRACLPLLVPSLGLALLGELDEREGRGVPYCDSPFDSCALSDDVNATATAASATRTLRG